MNYFLAASIIAALSDKDVLEFERGLQLGAAQAEIQKFTKTRIPNYLDFLTATLLEFCAVYLGLVT